MRNSRILKLFSYIMLPIFVGILIISIFYIQVKDATYYDEEKYFESESFMSLYMTILKMEIHIFFIRQMVNLIMMHQECIF